MTRSPKHRARLRTQVAQVAAELMYREGVSQYLEAKRIAARRVLGREARGAQYRPGSLPSNGEIREALLALVALCEGADRSRRLFAMRIAALQQLRALAHWHARLIGSVASGHARQGSDIDLHLFGEADAIELDLWQRGYTFEPSHVLIQTPTGMRTFRHAHLTGLAFPVELSLYEERERRVTTRSSTDGRPIDRVSAARLEALIAREHPQRWQAWLEGGTLDLEGLDGHREYYAGLLLELSTEESEPGPH